MASGKAREGHGCGFGASAPDCLFPAFERLGGGLRGGVVYQASTMCFPERGGNGVDCGVGGGGCDGGGELVVEHGGSAVQAVARKSRIPAAWFRLTGPAACETFAPATGVRKCIRNLDGSAVSAAEPFGFYGYGKFVNSAATRTQISKSLAPASSFPP